MHTPQVYRLNLSEGRFLAPLATRSPAANACGISPAHGLLACAGEDGGLECFDLRQRSSLGWLDAAGAAGARGSPLTALRFDDSGMHLAVGTGSGLVALFDLRSQVGGRLLGAGLITGARSEGQRASGPCVRLSACTPSRAHCLLPALPTPPSAPWGQRTHSPGLPLSLLLPNARSGSASWSKQTTRTPPLPHFAQLLVSSTPLPSLLVCSAPWWSRTSVRLTSAPP